MTPARSRRAAATPAARRGRALLLGLALLAGCAPHHRAPPAAAPAPAPSPIDRVVGLLNSGDEAGARRLLRPMLRHPPIDPAIAVLAESLDRDPVDLLGPDSYRYMVQPGDTMLGLAERLLGNRLKFYQLARYNGIIVPSGLAPGTVLRIPGRPPHAAPPPIERAPAPPRHAPPAPPAAAMPPPSPPAPASNPALAKRLRVAGLTALGQGRPADAVALLRHAAALDPANPLIARDLQRAERIEHTVESRR